jgi:hypothetical protein
MCYQYREQIKNLDELTQQQQINLAWRLLCFTEIPDETKAKNAIKRLVRESSIEMEFIELIVNKKIEDISIEDILSINKIELKQTEIFGL